MERKEAEQPGFDDLEKQSNGELRSSFDTGRGDGASPLQRALLRKKMLRRAEQRRGAAPPANRTREEQPGSVGSASERFPFQHEMEALFGQDFANVRVEFNAQQSLEQVGAHAAAEGEVLRFADRSPD